MSIEIEKSKGDIDMNRDAETKIKLLTANYSDYAKKYVEWKDKYHDDRRLYQNMYESMIESLKIMGEIENNYIWVAFNHEFRKDLETMNSIIKRFDEIEKIITL